MSLAPEGREGLFTALASAPLFAAKLPTGAGHALHLHTDLCVLCLAPLLVNLHPRPR